MRLLRWSYIIGLHLILAVLVWKTNFIELVERRIGVWAPREMDRSWHNAVAAQRRVDSQLPPGALLFIGDSLILGLDVTRFGRPAANFGIGWDTTAGALARLDAYRSIATAGAVVLLIGTNDLHYRAPDSISHNLRQILARLTPSTVVVAIGLLPVDERRRGAGRNAVLAGINSELERACSGYARCRYIDAWPALAPNGSLSPEYHEGDGLHLSRAGYDRLADVIVGALAP